MRDVVFHPFVVVLSDQFRVTVWTVQDKGGEIAEEREKFQSEVNIKTAVV